MYKEDVDGAIYKFECRHILLPFSAPILLGRASRISQISYSEL